MESPPDFEGEDMQEQAPATAEPARPASQKSETEDKAPQGGLREDSKGKEPKAPSAGASSDKPSETEEPEKKDGPWVPKRVQTALDKSSSFDQFRQNRPFRYLHMFSGEDDQLAKSLKVEASKARLQIYVESLDGKRDSDLNLASHVVYDEIEKSITNGEWDGFHSGFPCGSFSRVRWRDSPDGLMPVRSAAHIYGLPGNTPEQQKEADNGTLMAVRSAWLHEKQVASCRLRAVPEVSTLENPPGSENSGSAWDLPEIEAVIADTASSTVEFNTCAYQTKLKERWYKPSRWTGKLESLSSLARVCKCQPWVKHVPLIGKGRTEAAGAYPEDLANAVAKKVVEAWKRILNLEWLRHHLQQKSNKVNELQVKWLENEEKRRKRLYVDAEPSNTRPLTTETKVRKVMSKATEVHDKEEESAVFFSGALKETAKGRGK